MVGKIMKGGEPPTTLASVFHDFAHHDFAESDVECVVVRSGLLDPLLSRADLDPCDPDEFLPLMAELLEDEDWSVPLANTENIAS